jgi:hypothetical protein
MAVVMVGQDRPNDTTAPKEEVKERMATQSAAGGFCTPQQPHRLTACKAA